MPLSSLVFCIFAGSVYLQFRICNAIDSCSFLLSPLDYFPHTDRMFGFRQNMLHNMVNHAWSITFWRVVYHWRGLCWSDEEFLGLASFTVDSNILEMQVLSYSKASLGIAAQQVDFCLNLIFESLDRGSVNWTLMIKGVDRNWFKKRLYALWEN